MTKIYIHIGAGKAGSSSLQKFFSTNPVLDTENQGEIRYYALKTTGFSSGNEVRANALNSPFQYESSADFNDFLNPDQINKSLKKIAVEAKSGKFDVLLSSEDYINRAEKFAEKKLFDGVMADVELIMYLRPPLDWLNSAYWQWGAWVDVPKNQFLRKNFNGAAWYDYYRAWNEVQNINKIHVRLATTDVVQDMLNLFSVSYYSEILRQNSGTSPDLLRFLQRNRDYRNGPHDSQVEFIVSNLLNRENTKSPWVIGPDIQREIFDFLGDQYKSFENVMEPEIWQDMKNDQRWWSNESYLGRGANEEKISDLESADRLISNLIDAYLIERWVPRE